jgi:FkbM family methyltransferase
MVRLSVLNKFKTYFFIPLKNIFYFLLNIKSISFLSKIKLIIIGLRNIVAKIYIISFYSKKLYYDNLYNSINIINYPIEVENLSKKVDFNQMKSVLDIGASIGAYSYVLKSIYPHLYIYSFEPNKDIFPLLKKNSSQFENWKCFNSAIGKDNQKLTFYHVKNKSAQGSFYKQNAKYRLEGELLSDEIKTLSLSSNNLKKLNIPLNIDFIKIDAEGFEKIILENLDIKPKFLYFEFTGDSDDLLKFENIILNLKNKFGNFKIIIDDNSNSRIKEFLIEF